MTIVCEAFSLIYIMPLLILAITIVLIVFLAVQARYENKHKDWEDRDN